MATKTVSIVTGGSNLAPTTAAEINAVATDFISSGVVGSVSLNTGSGGTGSFAVNAQASPGMSVRVSSGQLYVSATPTGGSSQKVRVSMDTFEDVTISSNSTGGTRYDWLYAKVDPDKLLNPGANKDDVVTLVTSRSTSSSTDNGTPPTYGYNLGVITVANGASSITNSNITDNRTQTGAKSNSLVTGITTADVVKNPYKFYAYRNAVWTTSNNAYGLVPYDAELFDTGNNFDSTTNKGRFTAPIAGFYQFNATASTATSASGSNYALKFYKNGGTAESGVSNIAAGAANGVACAISSLIQLAANDYVEVYFYSHAEAGGTGSGNTSFSGFLVSAT